MSVFWSVITGNDAKTLIITDHASNHVPDDIDLGVPSDVMTRHMAIDIGVKAVTRALCGLLDCSAMIAGTSRLVVDLNRDADDPAAIPIISDGVIIPGNAALDETGRAERIARFHTPYHAEVAAIIARSQPDLIVSVHSFTPRLETATDETPHRPWEIGILYNMDDRAARIAIPLLEQAGVVTGDNEPYSGKILNATMNRHAEANHIPYLGFEIRQDLIDFEAGVIRWAEIIAKIVTETRKRLA